MTRTTCIGVALTAIAVFLCGCRSQASGPFSSTAPSMPTSVGYQGFVPDTVGTGVTSESAPSCGPGCSSCGARGLCPRYPAHWGLIPVRPHNRQRLSFTEPVHGPAFSRLLLQPNLRLAYVGLS